MKKLIFEVDGRKLSGFAKIVEDQVWVHFEGRTFQVASQNSTQRKDSRKAGVKSGNILAPMPGKITKILVNIGDTVEENQSILVMEAMKMEYSLKAQIAGTIKEIFFSVESQVSLGSTLAIIEKAKDT
jgi:biotin carboxyl carrier protein